MFSFGRDQEIVSLRRIVLERGAPAGYFGADRQDMAIRDSIEHALLYPRLVYRTR